MNINNLRAKIIRIEDKENEIVIRSILGKKKISKKHISVLDYSLFSKNYGLERACSKINALDGCKKYGTKISIQGFCDSGSTALIDLLREFDNVTSVCGIETDTCNSNAIENEVGGIELDFYRDLELYRFVELLEMSEFEADMFIKKTIFNARKILGDLQKSNIECDIVSEFNKMLFKIIDLLHANIVDINKLPPVTSKCNYENNLKLDCRGGYVFYKVKDGIKSEQIKQCIFDFVETIFSCINSKEYLILDQFLGCARFDIDNRLVDNGYDIDFHRSFVGDIKQISVYRDPRDQFVSNWMQSFFLYSSLGKQGAYAPLYDVDNYKMRLKFYKNFHSDRLFISFESLVNDYENSVDKICNFLGIDKSHHVNKFKHFNPEVSRKNIGIYKNFHDQKLMQQIYENFKEYCYEG